MSLKRIAIFLPRATAFYAGLLQQMRRGFEEDGWEVSGGLGYLDAQELKELCYNKRIQVVFEMNRARNEAHGLPPSVRHICWLVDLNGRSLSDFEGSDITYLFSPAWPALFPHRSYRRWFGPGADPEDYPQRPCNHEIQISFAGHIPNPWTPEELARDLTGGTGEYRFADLVPDLADWLRVAPQHRNPRFPDSMSFARWHAEEKAGVQLHPGPTEMYDIRGRVVRQTRRCDLADALVSSCSGVAFFGPENWSRWSKYSRHYRKSLDTPAELHSVYSASTINVHEGVGTHFRTMDIMSSGGLLFFREHWHDHYPGGMFDLFEPHVDYVPFRFDNLGDVARKYTEDRELADRVRENAAETIARRHTWRHRSIEVRNDLSQLS